MHYCERADHSGQRNVRRREKTRLPLATLPLYFFFLEEFYTRNHLGLGDEGVRGGRWGAGGGETNGDYQLHQCENVREKNLFQRAVLRGKRASYPLVDSEESYYESICRFEMHLGNRRTFQRGSNSDSIYSMASIMKHGRNNITFPIDHR